eukprot:gene25842-34430_t
MVIGRLFSLTLVFVALFVISGLSIDNRYISIRCRDSSDVPLVRKREKLRSIVAIASSSQSGFFEKPTNKFQSLVQKLNLNEKQNQLFYDFCLSVLSCLVGVITTLVVVSSRRAISLIDKRLRSPHPILLPILGSILVCILYFFDGRVGNSPFNADYLKANFHAKSSRYIGTSLDLNTPIQFIYPSTSREDPSSTNKTTIFSSLRQLTRLLAVIISVGSGCSLGFTGPAAELGMSISHVLGYFLPEYASKDRSSISYTTSESGEVTVVSAASASSGSFKMYDEVTSNYNANRKYYLLLAGAGAGVAANFNAPLTGAMYSIEISKLLFLSQSNNAVGSIGGGKHSSDNKGHNGNGKQEFQLQQQQDDDNINPDPEFNENDYRYLNINRGKSSALLLAVSAAALTVRGGLMIGSKKILDSKIDVRLIPSSVIEIPLFLAMGILSGSLSFVFSMMKQRLFRLFSAVPTLYRPLIGGGSCAIAAAIGSPQSLAVGYSTLNRIISGDLKNPIMLSNFMVGKLIMVAISASSGLIGGQFAPSLFLGAAFGAVFYQLSAFLLPNFVMHNFTVYVLVGAASMIAATFRAPLTGALLIIELTKQLDLTLPLIVSTGMASLVSKILTRV